MLQKIIDGQYRRPSGLLGRWIGGKMARQHVPENTWTVSLLNAAPDDRILEVGFGPGLALEHLSRSLTRGLIAGVDFSHTMVSAAIRRNAQAVRAGRMDLRYGDAAHLPFAEGQFDKAYSIHSIYFWPQPEQALREIHRVLKPGGEIILTVLPRERWNAGNPDQPIGTPECVPYSGDQLMAMLAACGYVSARIEADTRPDASPSNYSVIATKPAG